MDTGGYILELLKSGLWVFPVRGKGQSLEECKRPMSFKSGDERSNQKRLKVPLPLFAS